MIALRRIVRAAFLAALVVIAALVAVGVAARFHDGLIGPFPGGALVEKDGRVRVRVDGKIYELQATRVSDPAIAKKLSEAVSAKYGVGDGSPTEGAWVFELVPRR